MNEDRKDPLSGTSDQDRMAAEPPHQGKPARSEETEAPRADSRKPGSEPADVQAYIGRQLRAVYDDVAKQPIPERFLLLMKRLEEK